MTQDPTRGEPTGPDAESVAGEDAQDQQVDTGMENPDLHGQAQEVQESASPPGPGETPAG